MQNTAGIADFKARLRGQLIEPNDQGYDEIRALYNGMIDRRPRISHAAPTWRMSSMP